MANLDQIKKLLGGGLSAGIVAEAVGVTPSYISQLLENPQFKEEVEVIRAKDLVNNKRIDEKYDEIEDKLLDQLEKVIPLIHKPSEIVRTIQVINGAKRKSVTVGDGEALMAGTIVNLNLPKIIYKKYTINMAGGMVQVDDRPLTPMPSSALLQSLESRKKKKKRSELPAEIITEKLTSERIAHEDKV